MSHPYEMIKKLKKIGVLVPQHLVVVVVVVIT
jgi:hypothetical protein